MNQYLVAHRETKTRKFIKALKQSDALWKAAGSKSKIKEWIADEKAAYYTKFEIQVLKTYGTIYPTKDQTLGVWEKEFDVTAN